MSGGRLHPPLTRAAAPKGQRRPYARLLCDRLRATFLNGPEARLEAKPFGKAGASITQSIAPAHRIGLASGAASGPDFSIHPLPDYRQTPCLRRPHGIGQSDVARAKRRQRLPTFSGKPCQNGRNQTKTCPSASGRPIAVALACVP